MKDILITPYVDLKTEYYDLSLENRDATDDKVTVEAAEACLRLGVGVKCATITPNAQRVGGIRAQEDVGEPQRYHPCEDGTARSSAHPSSCAAVTPLVPGWKKPIVIARHAYGDVYKGVEMKAKGGKATLSCDGNTVTVFDFGGKEGILQAIHNTKASIESFCQKLLQLRSRHPRTRPLVLGTKDTISKTYDHTFKDIFQDIYDAEYKAKFEAAGIEYFYTLIDDAVARVMRSEGGFIWALKNYDGDVMSDMVATRVRVSCHDDLRARFAHGSVRVRGGARHRHPSLPRGANIEKGEETSTNSVATLFAVGRER